MKKRQGLKSIFKIIAVSALVFVLLFVGKYYKQVSYGIGQLYGQFGIITNTKSIEEYLNSGDLSSEHKLKLELVGEVKSFAEDSLGLNPTDNYTTVFDQKGQDILWNVTASKKFELESYEWDFPLVGSFSYKGFFNYDLAKEEYQRRLEDDLDVRLSPVSAWSTLGMFRDPILSNMLDRSMGDLAELIIHEMTHATLYVKDDVEFNENLATFIGEKGAMQFLRYYVGKEHEVYTDYIREKEMERWWIDYVMRGAENLDSLYMGISDYDVDYKYILKSAYITLFVENANIERESRGLSEFLSDSTYINNTYFLAYRRYHGGQEVLDSLYNTQFNEDFEQMLNYYRIRY